MYGLRLFVNIQRVGRRLVAWVDEQPLQPWASQHDGLLREVHVAEEVLEAGVGAQGESVVAGGDETAESLELQSCHPDGDPRETNCCFCFALFPSVIRKIALLPFAWGEKNPVTSSS